MPNACGAVDRNSSWFSAKENSREPSWRTKREAPAPSADELDGVPAMLYDYLNLRRAPACDLSRLSRVEEADLSTPHLFDLNTSLASLTLLAWG